jgi:methyl-accepting chemotaxis protein
VLLEGTVSKVKDGSGLFDKTNEAFSQVSTDVVKMTDLIGGIATASREQAKGIDEISRAMTSMDSVVQQAAANAEESSSLSVEMSTQAKKLEEIVENLAAVIGGRSGR